MLHIPKIFDYLKILTGDEVKDFAVINFSEFFKSTREKLYSKQIEEQNFKKVAESLYIFLTTADEEERYGKIMQSNSSDKYLHCYKIEILNLSD